MIKNNETLHPFAVVQQGERALFVCGMDCPKGLRIFLSQSDDGLVFYNRYEIYILSENGKEIHLPDSGSIISFFYYRKEHFLVYTKTVSGKKKRMVAKSTDGIHFLTLGKVDALPEFPMLVSNHKYKKNFLAYYTAGKSIQVAASSDLLSWHTTGELFPQRKGYFDDGAELVAVGTLSVEKGILVLYEAKSKIKGGRKIKIGGALFHADRPYHPIWKSEEPIWEESLDAKKQPTRFLGAVLIGDSLHIYWKNKEKEFFVKTINVSSSGFVGGSQAKQLKRHNQNPIIRPIAKNKWEQDATFNPAALYLDGKVHLIYRAIGDNGVSVFGYASSADGFTINERLDQPVFAPVQPLKKDKKNLPVASQYVSGGSWVGCEDPRLTRVGDRIYMTYVAFDGYNPPGVALTSISVHDFLSKVWKWKHPVYISKHGEIQKNWMVFPEKIQGKYAVLHSITPKISIEYIDDLDNSDFVIDSKKMPGVDEHRWDNIVRGAGAPPLETKYGWLVLYHAMDKRDPNKYKVGAMLLDRDDPTKILHRCKHPILEPLELYENHGAKSGVVYVCGAVIKDNTLFVYYGGADSVVCVATQDLDEFLGDMIKHMEDTPSLFKKVNKLNYL